MVRLYQEEDGEAEVKEEKSWAIEQSNSAKKTKKVRPQPDPQPTPEQHQNKPKSTPNGP